MMRPVAFTTAFLVIARNALVSSTRKYNYRDRWVALRSTLTNTSLEEVDTSSSLALDAGDWHEDNQGEVHCVFTVDCHPFNLWQTELLFYSARQVGQQGPITGIVSGCSEEKKASVLQRHEQLSWPAQFKLHFVKQFNDKTSRWMSKPFGVKSWFHEAGPERDIVAVMDPDFVFLRPLTADLDGASSAMAWEGEVPTRIQKGVVVAQRYGLKIPDPNAQGLFEMPLKSDVGTDFQSRLAYICSGSSTGKTGCSNVTNREMGLYQSTGVPYLAHRDDWAWLADDWAAVMGRLHDHYAGNQLYADMWAWSLANQHRNQRQLVLHSLILTTVSAPQADWERWGPVDALTLDACSNPLEQTLLEKTSAEWPHFIHYCGPLDSFNKYWFDWGATEGQHALERCDEGAESSGLSNLMATVQNRTEEELKKDKEAKFHSLAEQHRARFLGCTMRSFFKAALRNSCGDKPSGSFVSQGDI